MPSLSRNRFQTRLNDLEYLRKLISDTRIKPLKNHQKQIYLHSYLAAIVASWDAFLKSISKEYLSTINNPADVRYNALFRSLEQFALTKLNKFNTPNFENTRNLLLEITGYDPLGDTIWIPRRFTGIQTRDRLNEILKVRHSFAHGSTMPSYSWNRSSSGVVRLTASSVDDCRSLIEYLVIRYENGLQTLLISTHGINPGW